MVIMYGAVNTSPARRSPDSLDEELVDINNEYKNLQMIHRRHIDDSLHLQEGDSDEDTEDASEEGDIRAEEPVEMKEQMYFDKVSGLRRQLEDLEARTHPEYLRRVTLLENVYKHSLMLNVVEMDGIKDWIEQDYKIEKLTAVHEFEEKKTELKDSLITELEEKRKLIEQDRFSMELACDTGEAKAPSTRKLRRRPNEPIPIQEKRRKTPQSQVTFLLDEKEVDEDVNTMKCSTRSVAFQRSKSVSSSSGSQSASDVRIVDGKLFYEKRWFHRGQAIYVEGKDIPRYSAIISAISQDSFLIRKIADQQKARIQLSCLVKGRCTIKRRA